MPAAKDVFFLNTIMNSFVDKNKTEDKSHTNTHSQVYKERETTIGKKILNKKKNILFVFSLYFH